MGFLDQIRGASQPDGNPQAGYMGLSTRPKQRYLDKVLMKQRDRNQNEVEGAAMASGMGPNVMGGALPTGMMARGGNIFGGGQ